jgi:hypothetical protein
MSSTETGSCARGVQGRRRTLHPASERVRETLPRVQGDNRLVAVCLYIYFLDSRSSIPEASHGQLRLRTHCSSSWWPCRAAPAQVCSSRGQRGSCPRAQCTALQLPALSGPRAGVLVPRARGMLRPRPLQHRKLPAQSGMCVRSSTSPTGNSAPAPGLGYRV